MADIPSILPSFLKTASNVNYNENQEPTKCWLDCDPGHDDACAIILAYFNEKIQLLGLSTVGGNQVLKKVTKNALDVLNICGLINNSTLASGLADSRSEQLHLNDCVHYGGLMIPVLEGLEKPLIRAGVNCGEIHGETGLAGTLFPSLPEHAISFTNRINQRHFTTLMYEYFKEHKQVTIIATGPLTNVALLLINYPDVVNYIEKIVLMGGAVGAGNTGAVSEFNIQVDPEAAHVVFESNLDIFMVPLEVTHTVLVTESILSRIKELNTKFSETMLKLLLFFKKTYAEVFGFVDPPLHDPTAVAFVINPNLFEFRLMRVDIEMSSQLSYGQTVCDIYNMSSKRKNVHVCLKLDVDKFWNLMLNAIQKANENSPLNK